jgi:hypothetical protein
LSAKIERPGKTFPPGKLFYITGSAKFCNGTSDAIVAQVVPEAISPVTEVEAISPVTEVEALIRSCLFQLTFREFSSSGTFNSETL